MAWSIGPLQEGGVSIGPLQPVIVSDFPQSVTVAVSSGASASETMAATPSVSVPVSAGASAGPAGSASQSVTIGVSAGTAASPLTDFPQSVSVGVEAGADASITASAAATIAVSASASASEAMAATKAVTIAVSASLAGESSEFVAPGSILSTESWGEPNIAGPLSPSSIESEESWGTPYVNAAQTATPGSIPTSESWGAPRVANVKTIKPGSIDSSESWGSPSLTQSSKPILAGSIESGESWGAPTLRGGVQTLQVFVGGIDRSAWTRRGTAKLTSQTLGRWTGSIDFENVPSGDMRLLDTDREWTPQRGQTILIKEFNETLFRGCIKTIKSTRPLSTNLVIYSCALGDKTSICDRRLVRKSYAAVSDGLQQWDIADVIRDIVANYLDGEGIALDPALPVSLGDLTAPLSPFISVTQAFDTIRDLSGLQWFIDLNQVLRFTDSVDADLAPIEITETSRNWQSIEVTETDEDYRNRQYVISNRKILPTSGGATGSSIVETYTMLDYGTGHGAIPDHVGYQPESVVRGMSPGYIVLHFGIGSITGIKVNNSPVSVYQAEQLTDGLITGSDAWWAYFTSQTVDFVFPHLYLAPGDVVEVTYVPVTSAASVAVDPVLVVDQPFVPAPGEQFGTCGSGRYDRAEQVTDVGTQEGLDAIATGLLARSGMIPKTAVIETYYRGLQVGQKIHADVVRQNLDNLDLFITQLSGQSNPDGVDLGQGSSFRWTASATNFPDVGNWVKTWERLWRRTQNAVPVDRVVAATIVLAPGAPLAAGINFTNPGKVNETGLLSEVIGRFQNPSTDQDLVIDVFINGVSIFDSAKLVMPAGFGGDVVLTSFARAGLYLFKNDTVTTQTSYRVTGAHPVAARSGTVVLRTLA